MVFGVSGICTEIIPKVRSICSMGLQTRSTYEYWICFSWIVFDIVKKLKLIHSIRAVLSVNLILCFGINVRRENLVTLNNTIFDSRPQIHKPTIMRTVQCALLVWWALDIEIIFYSTVTEMIWATKYSIITRLKTVYSDDTEHTISYFISGVIMWQYSFFRSTCYSLSQQFVSYFTFW